MSQQEKIGVFDQIRAGADTCVYCRGFDSGVNADCSIFHCQQKPDVSWVFFDLWKSGSSDGLLSVPLLYSLPWGQQRALCLKPVSGHTHELHNSTMIWVAVRLLLFCCFLFFKVWILWANCCKINHNQAIGRLKRHCLSYDLHEATERTLSIFLFLSK